MSNDATFPMNPFLAPWLRAAQAGGAWPAEMARQQVALLTEWNRHAVALMTAGWARAAAPAAPVLIPVAAPAPVPAPAAVAPAILDAVATLPEAAPVEAAPEPTVIEAVAEPVAAPAPAKPARKPKAAQLRATPQRRKAAEKAPATKGSRATRH